VFSPSGIIMHGRGGFGVQLRRLAHPEMFSGVPVEPDKDELAFPYYSGPLPGQPHVDRAKDMAEFEWPRIQHDAAVSSLDLWLTAEAGTRLGATSLRCEVLCEEGGGAQSTHVEVQVVDQ